MTEIEGNTRTLGAGCEAGSKWGRLGKRKHLHNTAMRIEDHVLNTE